MNGLNGLAGCLTRGCKVKWSHWAGEDGCAVTETPMEASYVSAPQLWPGTDPTIRSPFLPAGGLGWAHQHGWTAGGDPTFGCNRQAPRYLPAPNTSPWLGGEAWAAPYGGRAMAGPMGAGPVDRVVDEIKAMLDAGTQRFARFMVDLQGVVTDWREARDRFAAIGTDDAAIAAYAAEEGRKRTLAVYDALAGVFYRAWPDIGLQGERGMGFAWLAVLPFVIQAAQAIALIIGAYSLFAWVDTSRQTAQANRTQADNAQRICAANPNSPACLEAMRVAAQGVPPPPDPIAGALAGLGKIAMWGVIAFLGVKILGMVGEERRARRAFPVAAEATA